MLSGKVDDEMDEGQIRQNMFELECSFHFESVNFGCNNTISTQDSKQRCWTLECPIDFGYSPRGILCFITNDVGGYSFRVAFDYKIDKYSSLWISQGRESGGRRLHVLMWTPSSEWFMEYSKLVRRQGNSSCRLWLSFDCDASVSELEKVLVAGLWLPTHDSMSGVLFKKIIAKFAPKSSWSVASLSRWIKGSLMSGD